MKRELKGKLKGKTAAQRKALFKAAAASYKKPSIRSRVSKAVKRVGSARSQTKQPGGNSTGKGGFNTQKLFKVVRMASLAAPAVAQALTPNTPYIKAANILLRYTGFDMTDGQFKPKYLVEGYGPFVATSAITALVPKVTSLIRGFM
jgi:hypothetical protein